MALQCWLGMDPGTANFAVSVVDYDTETRKKRIRYVAMIANPIKNLTATPVRDKKRRNKTTLKRDEPSFAVGLALFAHEIEWIFDNFKITHAVGERFQTRGLKGDGIEVISMMLAIVFYIAFRRRVKFMTTTAGVWKNAVARQRGDLLSLYEYAKMMFKMEPHVIDSTMIALWHADKETPWATQGLVRKIQSRLVKLRDALS